jgi:DnaJ-class molecular chaperone
MTYDTWKSTEPDCLEEPCERCDPDPNAWVEESEAFEEAKGNKMPSHAAERARALTQGPCPRCHGEETEPRNAARPCNLCRGSGTAPVALTEAQRYQLLDDLYVDDQIERIKMGDEQEGFDEWMGLHFGGEASQ